MIIFNFGAVIILAIAVVIGLGLDTLFPALFHGAYSGFASSLIAITVGGARFWRRASNRINRNQLTFR